jgi:exopolysaccharide production protein ExoZ
MVIVRLRQENTIDGIQVLRAVAALMVVLQHAKFSVSGSENWPVFGGAGVDIFFVISGFVMAYTTQQLSDIKPSDSLSEASIFLRKRIARIVPLYWLALFWATRRDMPDLNLLKDFFFLPHWNALFLGSINPILLQGWTLNYEMFFYVLFAVAMLFGSRRNVLLIGTLIVLPFAALLMIDGSADVVGRFYSNDIILEFGFGVLLHLAIAKWDFPAWPRIAYLGLMLFGFAWLIAGYGHEPRSIDQGLPSILIVWSSIPACAGWLRFRILALLGNASYAIYLFHWASFGAVKPVASHLLSYVNTLMVFHIAVATLCGVLIHLLIETRLSNSAKWMLRLDRRVKLIPAN